MVERNKSTYWKMSYACKEAGNWCKVSQRLITPVNGLMVDESIHRSRMMCCNVLHDQIAGTFLEVYNTRNPKGRSRITRFGECSTCLDAAIADKLLKAENGDEEAQVYIGQHFLKLAEIESDSGTSGSTAVSWFIKASRQGNEEATSCLKICRDKKLGISEENQEDVEWCITTSKFEKEAREAARKLFYYLQPESGECSQISPRDFAAQLGQLTLSKKERKLLEKAGDIGSNKPVLENEFVDKVLRRLSGKGGKFSLFSTEGDWEAFYEMSWFKKFTKHPGMMMSWLVDSTVEVAGSQGAQWLRSLVPVSQIYTLVALCLYSAISIDAVVWILPLITFYLAYAILLVVTAQMLRSRRRLGDIRTIAGVLNRYAGAFDADSAASTYSWNSLKPYAMFFMFLPLCVAAVQMADESWVPSPELMVLSSLVAVACFFALNDRYDYLSVTSILVDIVFSILPNAVRHSPQIPVIHTVLWFLVGPGFALNLPVPGLHFMIGLPSLAFLIVPVIFVRMAAQKSWRGTYQILVPHLVCFLWWRLVVLFFTRSTWMGLSRAMIGWIGLVFLLPVLAIVIVAYIFYVIVQALSIASILKVLTTVALLFSASAYAMWSRSGFTFGSYFTLDGKSPLSRAVLVLVLILGSCIPFALLFGPTGGSGHDETGLLPWPLYYKYCDKSAEAASLATCAHFSGSSLAGNSTVLKISVTRIENSAEAFASWLPGPLADWMRCAYGTQYPSDCAVDVTDDESEVVRDACQFNIQRGRLCHLRDLDRYTYEILLSFPGGVASSDSSKSIRLVASDWFREPASFINVGDEVQFRAIISDVVNTGLSLRLSSIQCIACQEGSIIIHRHVTGWRILLAIKHAMQATWNFFLQPLFSFSQ